MPLTCPPEAVVVEAVRFQAGRNLLEGELLYPESAPPRAGVVLANPHPLLGGNLQNNVVRGLGDGLASGNLAVLRFNYRGVGNSQGPPVDVASNLAEFWQTSHIADELDLAFDLEAALDFLRAALPADLPLAIVGYSFGCALVPRVASIHELAGVVLIAPTVAKHDYEPFALVRIPKLVIAPEDDFATNAATLRSWFDRLPPPRRLLTTQRDNHFFRGHEAWLTETVVAFLDECWGRTKS
jgi:uncharacterized protein